MRACAISALLCFLSIFIFERASFAADAPAHGLWVWKTSDVLSQPGAAQSLRDFCSAAGINEVYLSFSAKQTESDEARLVECVHLLHRSHIRVDALLSSTDADEPGKPRDHFLAHCAEVNDFNQRHTADCFDGLHLDIEPQQRPENKGPGNLEFLPDLIETYRAVNAQAAQANMTVNVDIANKVLKADLDQRKDLFRAVPRVTLMFYELSSSDDGQTPEQKTEKLRKTAEKYLAQAYAGLSDVPNLAGMSIGLRTPDYLDLLPRMLLSLDEEFGGEPHYVGWARHSYNDSQ